MYHKRASDILDTEFRVSALQNYLSSPVLKVYHAHDALHGVADLVNRQYATQLRFCRHQMHSSSKQSSQYKDHIIVHIQGRQLAILFLFGIGIKGPRHQTWQEGVLFRKNCASEFVYAVQLQLLLHT
jgi:hypothetical protein